MRLVIYEQCVRTTPLAFQAASGVRRSCTVHDGAAEPQLTGAATSGRGAKRKLDGIAEQYEALAEGRVVTPVGLP